MPQRVCPLQSRAGGEHRNKKAAPGEGAALINIAPTVGRGFESPTGGSGVYRSILRLQGGDDGEILQRAGIALHFSTGGDLL